MKINLNQQSKNSTRSYVLIDDDSTYRSIMKRAAEIENVHLDCFGSLIELGSVGALENYDVLILDYELDGITGVEIASYLGKLVSEIPTVIVSHTEREPGGWPKAIKRFVQKSEGYAYAIQNAKEIDTVSSHITDEYLADTLNTDNDFTKS